MNGRLCTVGTGLLAILVSAGSPALARPAGPTGRVRWASVERLATAQRLPEALAACNRYLARHRDERRAQIMQADLLAWTGNVAAALPAYDRLLQATPTDRSLRLRRAMARKWHGDLVTAEAELAALAPDEPEAATELQALRSEPEWPIAQARALATAHPEDALAILTLARALLGAEQHWEAQETLTAGLAVHPNDPGLVALQAKVEAQSQAAAAARIEQRAPVLQAADDGDPRRIEQGTDLTTVGRLAAAAGEYRRFARAHPARRDIRLQEARIRSWYGDLGRSTALYDDLIAGEPDDAVTRLEAARVLAWDGRLAAAEHAAIALRDRSDVGPGATALLGDLARWDGARVRPALLYADALARGLDGDAAQEARRVLDRDRRYWLFTPEYRWFRDSAGFTSVAAGLRIVRQLDVATRLSATGFHFDYHRKSRGLAAERGAFALEREGSRWRGALELGASGYSSGPVRPAAAARIEWFPRAESTLGAGYEHYDLLDEVTTLSAVTRTPADRGPLILQGDRARVWLRWPLPGELRLSAEANLASITDGNRSDGAGVSLARRLWRQPRIDLAIDLRTYGVAERRPRYWSPARYWTTGTTVSIEQKLGWGLSLRGEGRGGYAEENGTSTAEVSYAIALTTDPDCPWSVALGYRGGRSAREGGYGIDAVTATISYRPPTSVP